MKLPRRASHITPKVLNRRIFGPRILFQIVLGLLLSSETTKSTASAARTLYHLVVGVSSTSSPLASPQRQKGSAARTSKYSLRLPSNRTTTGQDNITTEEHFEISDKEISNFTDAEVLGSKGRIVSASASITLPFSSHVAYDAFSDVRRQPSWSPWLRSVSYLDGSFDVSNNANKSEPFRETQWVAAFAGFPMK